MLDLATKGMLGLGVVFEIITAVRLSGSESTKSVLPFLKGTPEEGRAYRLIILMLAAARAAVLADYTNPTVSALNAAVHTIECAHFAHEIFVVRRAPLGPAFFSGKNLAEFGIMLPVLLQTYLYLRHFAMLK